MNKVLMSAAVGVAVAASVPTGAYAGQAAPTCWMSDAATGTVGSGSAADNFWLMGTGLQKSKPVERDLTDPLNKTTVHVGNASVSGTVGDYEYTEYVAGTYHAVLRTPADASGKSTVFASCSYTVS